MSKLKRTLLVAKHEFKAFQENGLKLFIFFYTFVLLGVWTGNYVQLAAASVKNKHAKEIIDSEWKDQNRNNHSAAHWGTFLFKPISYLSLLESGTNVYSENQYRVEAHKRPQMHSYRLRDLEAFMRRPDLNTAFFFQWFMPLIIIGLGFSSVSSEREKGFLKMLSVQGASFGQLLAGKFMALYTAVLLFIVPPLVIMFAGLIFEGEPVDHLIRAGYWIVLYAVYFLIISGGVLLISALSRSSWSSLLANITVWVLCVLLIPKLATSAADNFYPLSSYHEFEHNIKTGFDKGLGNDGGYTSRSESYLKRHLSQYNAASIEKLPEKVRFALDLIQAEAYENKVNAFYSKKVEDRFNQQQEFMDYMGIINPFIAIRQLSMAFAGTDVQHHIDFFNKAEEYRNTMMDRLNKRELEIAVSGKTKVDNRFFYSNLPDFSYQYPTAGSVIRNHPIAVLSLFFWTLILMLSFRLIINRNYF
ncbi:hypothetical protein BOQ62_17740 [Chryseobacterium sp. CH21]|uniref:DUF3526 domain-containing protein n=1 Tax=Chryseobacterium sp. CH21 TaxID=713556 RepID=UPI00100B45D5|nr:DUF3526 domain-containing protein [Chryseobacterium sp. CH21]RXM38405.1 hypothetical protein BOQ62_17740 [Chryseobacterium sp. CH21]